MKEIVFLMGLPRSGTTLLQRVISAHPEVASVAETWVLLPLLTCFDERMISSVYGQFFLKQALADFQLECPEFKSDYDEHVRQFVSQIYGNLAGNKRYFLDKTPRYYLIAEDLHRVFPESKFIYLFRNPLEVFDSVIETFCSDRLYRLAYCHTDLMHGLNLLCSQIAVGQSNIHALTYEAFCANSEAETHKICDFLGVTYDSGMLQNFAKVAFSGKFGDPKRNLAQRVIKSESCRPLSIIRRRLYMRWVRNINPAAWEASGYVAAEILAQLRARPMAGLWKQLDDVIAFAVFRITMFFGYTLVLRFKKLRAVPSDDIDAFLC